MDLNDIKTKAEKMAAGGIDARTITVDFEVRLGRPLKADEAGALIDGWRAADTARMERSKNAAQRAADQAAGRASIALLEGETSAIICARRPKKRGPRKAPAR